MIIMAAYRRRPKGASQKRHYGVANLENGLPFLVEA